MQKIELIHQLEKTLGEVQVQHNYVARDISRNPRLSDLSIYEIRDTSGQYIMLPLIAARAQILHGLALAHTAKEVP